MVYLKIVEYNRENAVKYAKKWANGRNPLFYNFTGIGGDCTNFVSQCIYAGSCKMNYTPTFGWYYASPNNRAPAWSGVPYLYNFIVNNAGAGPFAAETGANGLLPGDFVQLGRASGHFYHTLLVTSVVGGRYYVSTHTFDAFDRALDTYTYEAIRYIHIKGVRVPDDFSPGCFAALYEGRRIL